MQGHGHGAVGTDQEGRDLESELVRERGRRSVRAETDRIVVSMSHDGKG